MIAPRLSLKWMFIAFSVLTVVFYLAYIRPRATAERFVSAVKHGDFTEFNTLTVGNELFKDRLRLQIPDLPAVDQAEISGEVGSLRWRDVVRFRRGCYVMFAYPRTEQLSSGQYQTAVHVYAVAGIGGVEGMSWTTQFKKK